HVECESNGCRLVIGTVAELLCYLIGISPGVAEVGCGYCRLITPGHHNDNQASTRVCRCERLRKIATAHNGTGLFMGYGEYRICHRNSDRAAGCRVARGVRSS